MLREKLADLCHRQWSGWMEYLFSKGSFNEDGTWTMPVWAVKRWKRQMETPYAQLSQSEQESDRVEADKFLEATTGLVVAGNSFIATTKDYLTGEGSGGRIALVTDGQELSHVKLDL